MTTEATPEGVAVDLWGRRLAVSRLGRIERLVAAAPSHPPTPPVPRWWPGPSCERHLRPGGRVLRREPRAGAGHRAGRRSGRGGGQPGGRLLEIGVGTGRIALPLHRRGREIVGIDLSLPMLDRFRARRPPNSATDGMRADAGRLPVPRRLRRRRARGPRAAPGPRLETGAGRDAAGPRAGRDAAARRGGAYERGGGGPRDQVMRRFDGLAFAGGGPPRVVGAISTGRCWTPWSPWASGWRSWSRSSGRSRRPTPRRCAGSRRVFSSPLASARRALAERRRWVRAEIEGAHPDLDTPHPSGHAFKFTAIPVLTATAGAGQLGDQLQLLVLEHRERQAGEVGDHLLDPQRLPVP